MRRGHSTKLLTALNRKAPPEAGDRSVVIAANRTARTTAVSRGGWCDDVKQPGLGLKRGWEEHGYRSQFTILTTAAVSSQQARRDADLSSRRRLGRIECPFSLHKRWYMCEIPRNNRRSRSSATLRPIVCRSWRQQQIGTKEPEIFFFGLLLCVCVSVCFRPICSCLQHYHGQF